jgi:hypothetical protein
MAIVFVVDDDVSAHRGQVMTKMKAQSLPHPVRMAAGLEWQYCAGTDQLCTAGARWSPSAIRTSSASE